MMRWNTSRSLGVRLATNPAKYFQRIISLLRLLVTQQGSINSLKQFVLGYGFLQKILSSTLDGSYSLFDIAMTGQKYDG